MRKTFLIFGLVLGFLLSWNGVCAAEKVVVIPLCDEPVAQSLSDATRVPKTGQTGCWDEGGSSITCMGTGQDGEYQLGVLPEVTPSDGKYGSYTVYGWSGVRFKDNVDGTVTDNLTGLIWLKNANCPNGKKNWSDALVFANSLYDGWTGDPDGGDCALSDGSSAGDWRLPNINELHSLVDPKEFAPALPPGPFKGVQLYAYWSSTTHADTPVYAWGVDPFFGAAGSASKGLDFYVWPVRGGQ